MPAGPGPRDPAGEPRRGREPKTANQTKLSSSEVREVQDRLRLRAVVVYQIVREEGDEELERSSSSLWWSGLAAGLSIGLSLVAKGLLVAYLPDGDWAPLVANLGYSVGFLVVILSREQLFTENTVTAVLPLAADCTRRNLARVARLWGIVLAANLAGAALFAAGLSSALLFPEPVGQAFVEISRHQMEVPPLPQFLRAIVAGWLVAILVWLLPSAEQSRFWVIVVIAYLIALGGLGHVIAGSVEAFLLLFLGEIGPFRAIGGFLLPTLSGNIVGGSALFALIAYAQVRREI